MIILVVLAVIVTAAIFYADDFLGEELRQSPWGDK